ncbi:uncharacterized protein [Euwallacea fornicatus]|uniref:uncharacterized protein isoform X2 n=1 Tax=Euwallacea fornicatus TaxID=995702 RepID=UPI00338EC34D
MHNGSSLKPQTRTILSHITNGNHQNFIKGDSIWKKMEMERVCDFRSWQSMKNRFMRNILAHKNRPEYGLTHKEIQSLENINQSTAVPDPKKNCVSIYNCDSPLVIKRKCDTWEDRSGKRKSETQDDGSTKRRSDTQEHRSAKSVPIPRTIRYNSIYSVEEDKELINHFLHNCTFLQDAPYENNGWKKLEAENICPGRNWQSMKNRFIRYIYPSIINPIYNLSEEEIAWITNCFSSKPDLAKFNKHSSFVEISSSSDESLDVLQIKSDASVSPDSKSSHEVEATSTSRAQFCGKSAHVSHSEKVLNPFAKSAFALLKKSQRNRLANKIKVNNKGSASPKKTIHVASSSKNRERVESHVTPNDSNDFVDGINEVEILRASSSDTDECNVTPPNDFYSIAMKWTDSDTS